MSNEELMDKIKYYESKLSRFNNDKACTEMLLFCIEGLNNCLNNIHVYTEVIKNDISDKPELKTFFACSYCGKVKDLPL